MRPPNTAAGAIRAIAAIKTTASVGRALNTSTDSSGTPPVAFVRGFVAHKTTAHPNIREPLVTSAYSLCAEVTSRVRYAAPRRVDREVAGLGRLPAAIEVSRVEFMDPKSLQESISPAGNAEVHE
jgi:hypothetical protein